MTLTCGHFQQPLDFLHFYIGVSRSPLPFFERIVHVWRLSPSPFVMIVIQEEQQSASMPYFHICSLPHATTHAIDTAIHLLSVTGCHMENAFRPSLALELSLIYQ